jgi:hypothetical protein
MTYLAPTLYTLLVAGIFVLVWHLAAAEDKRRERAHNKMFAELLEKFKALRQNELLEQASALRSAGSKFYFPNRPCRPYERAEFSEQSFGHPRIGFTKIKEKP